MKHDVFFDAMRTESGPLGFSRLSHNQVQGTEAIINECAQQGATLEQAAYILATAWGESARRMWPVRENMNYSSRRIGQVFSKARLQGRSTLSLAHNPRELANTIYGGSWGKKNLGNRVGTNDGWNYRGFWIGQITGRRNALKWAKGLGITIEELDRHLNSLEFAVRGLVRPMLEGWATGRKLEEFIDGGNCDYVSARRVWNSMFEAEKYAAHARCFERALRVSGYESTPEIATPPAVQPSEETGGWGAIFRTLLSIFKRGA